MKKSSKRFYNYGKAIALQDPPHNEMPSILTQPNSVYTVEFDPDTFGIHLAKTVGLDLPPKIYGKSDDYFIKKILKTFKVTNKSLGVLLSGLKGTGKTVTAKKLALESGLPVIKITKSYENGLLSGIVNFLLEIPEPFVLFIDEFEKMFPVEQQTKFLPFLDGFGTNPVLTVLTVNEKTVSEYLSNRLQRIRYHKEYTSLDKDTILEITNDLLDQKYASLKDQLINTLLVNRAATTDVVVSMVQEINIHGESALQDIGLLNISTEYLPHYNNYKGSYFSKSKNILLTEVPGVHTVYVDIQGAALNKVMKAATEGGSYKHSVETYIECNKAPFSLTVHSIIDKIGLSEKDQTGSLLRVYTTVNAFDVSLSTGTGMYGNFNRDDFDWFLNFNQGAGTSFESELLLWMEHISGKENLSPEEVEEILNHKHYGPFISMMRQVYEMLYVDSENTELTVSLISGGTSRLVY